MRAHVAMLLCILAVGACKKSRDWGGKRLDKSVVELATKRLHIRHVEVGLELKFRKVATVVMVDVRNKHDKDVNVTLEGSLFDKDNKRLGQLAKQSLRVPSKQWRLFALVDSESKERKATAGASVRVAGVHALDYPAEIVVSKQKRFPDKANNRIVVQADVTNRGKAFGRTLILCAFYDKDNTPLSRSFSELRLKIGETQSIQFVGPNGGVRAAVYPGETFWH